MENCGVMRLFSLIGALLVLIIPFSYAQGDLAGIGSGTFIFGLLFYRIDWEFLILQGTDTESITLDWLTGSTQDGGYNFYFGDNYWFLGPLTLLILVLAIYFAATQSKRSFAPLLLVVSGALLTIGRFLELSEAETGFYDTSNNSSYWEIPLGLILAVLFALIDMAKAK